MMERSRNVEDVLPPGTRVEEFELDRALQSGGFGVTYLARDRSLGRRVAIKEYLPREWGGRRADGSVGPRSSSHEEDYRWGLARFLEEARTLARLDHPRIVRVHRVIEAWGTAYMVMEYVEGRDLEETLKAEGPWPEARVRALLEELLPGVALVHAAGLIHRDVKPANVMLRADGTPVLIDFGAARYAAGAHSHSLTSVLTPGYAPQEQYHQASGQQGAWTDVYALGAVAYRALSGQAPVEAPRRVEAAARRQPDPLAPVSQAAAGVVSESFGAAVASALAVFSEDRPRDVAAWRAQWGDSDINSGAVGGSSIPAVDTGQHGRNPAVVAGRRSSEGLGGGSDAGARPGSKEPWLRGDGRRMAYGAAALAVVAGAVVGLLNWLEGIGDVPTGQSPVAVSTDPSDPSGPGAPGDGPDGPGTPGPSALPTQGGTGEAAQTLGFRSIGEARDAVARIMEASGLRANFELEVDEGLNNVGAAIRSPCPNPGACRVIFYDPLFLLDIERQTDQWGPISIMAHEVAHHLLGHTVFGLDINTRYESDAAFLSGFILQRLGASLESAQAAARLIWSPRGSSFAMEIATGWREARRVDGAPMFLVGEEGELTRAVPRAADPLPDDRETVAPPR